MGALYQSPLIHNSPHHDGYTEVLPIVLEFVSSSD